MKTLFKKIVKYIFPQTYLAINVKSISYFAVGDKRLTITDMMDLYTQTSVLFYKGEKPIVIKKGWFSNVKIVKFDDATEEQKEILMKFAETL